MIRGAIKAVAAGALHGSGMSALIGSRPGVAGVPLVVGYHRVVEDFAAHARGYMPSMLISTATLEQQLDWIGRRYDFADPDHMDRWLAGERPGQKPVALITFDDGYRDVYEHALPLLRRKGIPAVVFVVTDLVGSGRMQLHDELFLSLAQALRAWPDPRPPLQSLLRDAGVYLPIAPDADLSRPLAVTRLLLGNLCQAELLSIVATLKHGSELPEADSYQAMDWDMLKRMQEADIRVGSHTRSHALLTNEGPTKIAEELRASRQALRERLGRSADHLAYPDGRFDRSVVGEAADAGYRFGYTTCRHRDAAYPALSIPRRLLWEHSCLDAFGRFSPSVMGCQVNGVFDFANHCGVDHAA